ncbi:DNA gyrase subunit A [Nitrococcus mobilis]|uniref:DNA gyrase subunit A n=1 Tax=Nitrococcus mobilis Nb-231 TaxID=314278 RepID=A4BM47_9GAMM|nr:DNA gyrase subunit A [Nitrococcus mobilis]EAR23385.1 DNA gyrase, A subunit [Nitrococcus mobilis Nb-231]
MSSVAKEILPVNLEDEMRRSYLDYAMSVIVGRALPDVRDGLKPVHRRVLYAMRELSNDWNRPYKKSARVVGDVIGKYHPHGDAAVYDTIVRMAQVFAMRYPLIDGQGNFGSVDGDAAAAMRYTEIRMARIAHDLLADLDKETVDFVDNYDGSEQEPTVLPTRIPNFLVNGGSGIAVGMATNVPPHNLGEVIDACMALIDDDSLTVDELMTYLPGPDLPTAAIINGVAGIREAYRTGRGRMVIRARCEFEEEARSGKVSLIVTELPYQVNKARLLEKIAGLVKEKRIEGITELRDESDKDGIRVVIELRRGEVPEVVLNNLYQHTQLESVVGINMVALAKGQPKLHSLRDVLDAFLRHRREVVTRRTVYELRKARERTHVLEGLAVALANIDEVIALIKASPGPAQAKAALLTRSWPPGSGITEMLQRAGAEVSKPEGLDASLGLVGAAYRLSETQAQAILDLRLQRLTGLEQNKIIEEYRDLLGSINELLAILGSGDRLMAVIREELLAIKEHYADPRRTEITANRVDLTLEDLIQPEDVVVTLSHGGYAKSQPLDSYQAQHRGGKGKAATKMKDEDFIDQLFLANTHDTLLCFSSHGKCYWLKVYELPHGSRGSRGKPIVNLLPLDPAERISAVVSIKEFDDQHFVFMATRKGTVKKTPLSDFSRPRSSGIIAVNLQEDDWLVNVGITDGEREIMLLTDAGKAIRFPEDAVRPMGRTAGGVRGIQLGTGQSVIQLLILGEGDILTATENGYGKRTPVAEYPRRSRGGRGVISIQTSERNGNVVGAAQVTEEDEIMLITNAGTLVRIPVAEISIVSRNTQGVKLIALGGEERLAGVARIEPLNDTVEDEDAC